ncbi:hypothetical protein BDN72DRAFT_836886 [Pluteus cervinus]|uniref:Uncharacterized protein n=1 Tax=Pluteus cervinus TaxID=181527 RepID=A0ACD3B1J5_9AGAR|nr:hypothetical protein BDN72DRAFT_836886 [Pluteus cervinus]
MDNFLSIPLPPVQPFARGSYQAKLKNPSSATRGPRYYDLHMSTTQTLRRVLHYPGFESEVTAYLHAELAKLSPGLIAWPDSALALRTVISRQTRYYGAEADVASYLSACIAPIVDIVNVAITKTPITNTPNPISWACSNGGAPSGRVNDQGIPDAMLIPAVGVLSNQDICAMSNMLGETWTTFLAVEIKTPMSAPGGVLAAIDALARSKEEYPWYQCRNPSQCATVNPHYGVDHPYHEIVNRASPDVPSFQHPASNDSTPPNRPSVYINKPIQSTMDATTSARYILQQAWASAVKQDATLILITTGNDAYFGVRHRKSQTLCLSPRFVLNTSSFVPLFLGVFLKGYAETCARAEVLRRTESWQILWNARIAKLSISKDLVETAKNCRYALENSSPLLVGKAQDITNLAIPRLGNWTIIEHLPFYFFAGVLVPPITIEELRAVTTWAPRVVPSTGSGAQRKRATNDDKSAPPNKKRMVNNEKKSVDIQQEAMTLKIHVQSSTLFSQFTHTGILVKNHKNDKNDKNDRNDKQTNYKVSCLFSPSFSQLVNMQTHFQNYTMLKRAGVRLLPHYGIWKSPDTLWSLMVADEAGRSLQDYGPWNLDDDQRSKFKEALAEIHSKGYRHGAISRSNLYIRFNDEGKCDVFILGFEHVQRLLVLAGDTPKKLEMDMLQLILDEQQDPSQEWRATSVYQDAASHISQPSPAAVAAAGQSEASTSNSNGQNIATTSQVGDTPMDTDD